jgi:hypothetical protein
VQIINGLRSSLALDYDRTFSIGLKGLTDQINQWIGLFCQVAGIKDWRYLMRIQHALLFVLHKCINHLDASELEKDKAISQSINVFDFLANEYHRQNHRSKRKVWPSPPSFRTETPRFAFLASGNLANGKANLPGTDFDRLSATFKSIAREVLEGLIAIENNIPVIARDKSGLLANISWSARLLVSQNPNLSNTSLKKIVEERAVAASAFAERHAFLATSRGYMNSYSPEKISALASRFTDRHLNNLNLLLTWQVSVVRPRKPLLSRSQKAWLKRNRRGDEPTASHFSAIPLGDRALRDAIELGIAPSELESEFLRGVQPGGYLHHRVSSSLIYQFEEATAWSRYVPGYSRLGQIYRNAFCIKWDEMAPAHRLAVFRLMVHLHVGILPELLNTIKVCTKQNGSKLLEEEGICLDENKKTFVHLLPVQLDPQTLLADSRRANRGIVEVPLPGIMQQMLTDLLNAFPPPKSGEKWISVETEIPQLLPRGISALKLVDTCERYYVVRYGCDPELMSLIAGMPALGRASSIHYFRTTYKRLQTDYHSAFEQFHGDIIKASGHPEIADHLPQIRSCRTDMISNEVGSKFFPNLKEVSRYLSNLRKRMAQLKKAPFPDFTAWREVLTLYVWEVLKISTGMRAMRYPRFHRYSLMSNGYIRLKDKGAAWRLIPIHNLVVELYKLLVKTNQRLWFSRMGRRPCADKEEIFFIDFNGSKRPLSHNAVISTAAKHEIKYPNIASNAYRHLMRSWIHQQRLSYRIADWILGHTQNGPSAMDRLSTIPMLHMRKQFLSSVEKLLQKLGVSLVEDWKY